MQVVEATINTTLRKLMYYPIVVIICWFPISITSFYLIYLQRSGRTVDSSTLKKANDLGIELAALQGLLNSLIFFTCNDHVRSRWRILFISTVFRNCYSDEYLEKLLLSERQTTNSNLTLEVDYCDDSRSYLDNLALPSLFTSASMAIRRSTMFRSSVTVTINDMRDTEIDIELSRSSINSQSFSSDQSEFAAHNPMQSNNDTKRSSVTNSISV